MKVTCPTCRASVEWTDGSPHRPFCSERCRLIDLGKWMEEEYRIECQEPEDAELEGAGPGNDEDSLLH